MIGYISNFCYKLLCLPVFVANVFLKLINIFVFFVFILIDAFSCSLKIKYSQKNNFTLAENNFGERKLSCTRLNFGEILIAGTKREVPGGQYRSILPACGAWHIIRFYYWPSARSRWLNIGWVLFLHFYGPRRRACYIIRDDYSQLDTMRLFGYLSSHIQCAHGIIVKYYWKKWTC